MIDSHVCSHQLTHDRLNKLEKKMVREYTCQLKQFIVTSRFNQYTWNENKSFLENNKKIGCIYCAPISITSIVQIDTPIFVLEMNNDTNRIMGIGMVKNHPHMNMFSVYDHGNYNRYQYVGKTRIDRLNMTQDEETIMRVFDILCFTGNTHQKRGNGLKLFPLNMLFRCLDICDLVGFFRTMFVSRKIENNK